VGAAGGETPRPVLSTVIEGQQVMESRKTKGELAIELMRAVIDDRLKNQLPVYEKNRRVETGEQKPATKSR
jgi:hypothetical protein